MARRIIGRGSGLVGVRDPGEGVGVDLAVQQHLEGPRVLHAQLVVLLDVDLGEERLVEKAPIGVVSAGVDVGAAPAALAARLGIQSHVVGAPGPALNTGWATELDAARPGLDALATRLDAVLTTGTLPITVIPRCAAALATLPV